MVSRSAGMSKSLPEDISELLILRPPLLPARSGLRWIATPAITHMTPAASLGEGTWASTTRPITVAVAGSNATIRAYLARESLAIAS